MTTWLAKLPGSVGGRIITAMEGFVSVYVDMAAPAEAVHAATAALPLPTNVFEISVDCSAVSDMFGCRIAVDLTGGFDEQSEGPAIARGYAQYLSVLLGVPVYAFYDLLRREYSAD